MFGLTESYQISTTGFAGTTDSEGHYEKNQFEKEYVLSKIRTLFGPPPDGTYLRWKGYPHDFGMYYEATLFWNAANSKIEDKAWNYIAKIESHDWEAEEVQLRNAWDIRDVASLTADNEVFNHIYTETKTNDQ